MKAISKLKNHISLLLLVVASCISFSCEEVEEPVTVTIEGGEWLIFQLAKIHVPEMDSNETTFQGTIGGHPVAMGRIPGDSLIFIIPDIGEGSTQLKVRIGNQVRIWNMELRDLSYHHDENVFFKNFIESNVKLNEAIRKIDDFKNLARDYAIWYEYFVQKLSHLTAEERQFLNGILNFYLNERLVSHIAASFDLSCINGPGNDLPLITGKLSFREFGHLYDYSYLPPSTFHQAVLAGLGLGVWFQYVLMEYLAEQTLKCPIIRDIEFIDLDLKKTLSEEDDTILEAGEIVSISYMGIFKSFGLEEMENPDLLIYPFRDAFIEKAQVGGDFVALIHHYRKSYHKELPTLPPNPLINPSNEPVTRRGPIVDSHSPMRVEVSNPTVRMVDFYIDQESMSFRLESLNGQPQLFNLEFGISVWLSYHSKTIPILLYTSCPVLVDVLLVGREHIADVRFAQEPYQIRWSNGMTGDRLINLSPGNYGLSLTDANGCGKELEFIVPEFGKMEDIEGNSYETVKIGNTWWMTENLRTSKLSDGTDIQLITANNIWSSTQQPAYSWLNNDSGKDMKLGKLYNNYAACCKICPEGWRVPTFEDVANLKAVIGEESVGKLRSVGGWTNPTRPSTNEYGLEILPSGSRSGDTGYFDDGEIATFWWDYIDHFRMPPIFIIDAQYNKILTSYSKSLQNGYSVRCVRD